MPVCLGYNIQEKILGNIVMEKVGLINHFKMFGFYSKVMRELYKPYVPIDQCNSNKFNFKKISD